jgi:flagellar M-ring protein FliF
MNLFDSFKTLSLRQRIVIVAASLTTILLVILMGRVVAKPSLDLLYADLDPSTAGEVIARLDNLDVAYRVQGGAIYVDTRRRDALRLELARDGLPRQDVVGYELFDDLNSFAMSSDMFDTAYWRAKEGELVRTLLSMPDVRAARVHIGLNQGRGFSRRNGSPTASVTLSASRRFDASRIKAVQYLVALAVAGLEPGDVAVIDVEGGLLSGPGLEPGGEPSVAAELSRAASIKADLLSLLEARVGRGNARVSVNIETEMTRETVTERRYDPESRVLRSQTTTETVDSSSGRDGATTVASNLPEGAAAGGTTQSERSESTDRAEYEISEILTNRESLPGAIRRLSVAVLIDHEKSVGPDGESIYEPRSAAELEAIQELAISATGIDVARGDQITVESLPFERTDVGELIEGPSPVARMLDLHLWDLVQLSIMSLVALALGLLVIRPLLRSGLSSHAAEDGALAPMSLNGPRQDMQLGGTTIQTGLPEPDPYASLNQAAKDHTDEAADLLNEWIGPAQDAAQNTTLIPTQNSTQEPA